jgi:hypothetical protein
MRRDSALRRAAADEGRVRGREFLGAMREGKWQVATGRHQREFFRVLGRPKSTPDGWMTGHGPRLTHVLSLLAQSSCAHAHPGHVPGASNGG